MAELIKNGAVFIHVPKTGGTWVRFVLRETKLWRGRVAFKHSVPAHVNDIMRIRPFHFLKHWPQRPWVTPGRLRRAFKFCFLRNPLCWYESWWKFMAGNWHPWEPGRWHPQRSIESCGDDDFNTYLENILRVHPGYVGQMYRSYVEGVDWVGKCESLEDDLVQALYAAGVEFQETTVRNYPQVNRSKSRLGEPRWDPQLMRRIVDSEADGIEHFGYWPHVERFCTDKGVKLAVSVPHERAAGSPI